MKSIVTTVLTANSGRSYNYTFEVFTNCKGMVKSVNMIEESSVKPRPYMLLDLLSKIMPQKLYVQQDLQVKFSMNPVLNPRVGYQGHPCLVIHHENMEKRYRLDQVVSYGWMVTIPAAHLRAMVSWWRNKQNREEVEYPPHEWVILCRYSEE